MNKHQDFLRSMDGWMGGWMDGWMDGWMEGRTHPCRTAGPGFRGAARLLLVVSKGVGDGRNGEKKSRSLHAFGLIKRNTSSATATTTRQGRLLTVARAELWLVDAVDEHGRAEFLQHDVGGAHVPPAVIGGVLVVHN